VYRRPFRVLERRRPDAESRGTRTFIGVLAIVLAAALATGTAGAFTQDQVRQLSERATRVSQELAGADAAAPAARRRAARRFATDVRGLAERFAELDPSSPAQGRFRDLAAASFRGMALQADRFAAGEVTWEALVGRLQSMARGTAAQVARLDERTGGRAGGDPVAVRDPPAAGSDWPWPAGRWWFWVFVAPVLVVAVLAIPVLLIVDLSALTGRGLDG
jgi:hypothetical protein